MWCSLSVAQIISELEEEAKSLQLIDERRQQIRAHILDTSLRYGVASSEASFVAVEEREDATEGTMLSAVPGTTTLATVLHSEDDDDDAAL